MRASQRRRPGFRLVELLTVIAVVVIGAGLLLPALTRVRDDGGRTQCINNLKGIGLAVWNFAGAHQNALPPLTCDAAYSEDSSLPYNGSLLLTLLPYQGDVDSRHFYGCALRLPNCTWYAPIPRPATPLAPSAAIVPGAYLSSSVVKGYVCPNDETVKDGYSVNQPGDSTLSGAAAAPWAASSYAANYQVFGSQNDFRATNPGNGCRAKYRTDNTPDGNCNTVIFGEQFAACGPNAGSLWAYPGIGNYSGTAYTWVTGSRPPAGVGNSIVNVAGMTNSRQWAAVFANGDATYGFTSGGVKGSIFDYNRAAPAAVLTEPYAAGQYWDAPPQGRVMPSQCDKARLQSFHFRRGVTVCMGDGSTRCIDSGISSSTWHAAILPDDGAPLGSDW
jgi:type II secretory pathway pseudopilin PulG